MNSRLRRIDDWALKASKAIDKDWRRCDDETGEECRGVRCPVGAHRAQVYLYRILDEIGQ